jgi:hypothetical protein
VVVVGGVKRHPVFRLRRRHPGDDVERVPAVTGADRDRNDIFQFGEPAPEPAAERDPIAPRRAPADKRDMLRQRAAMREQIVLARRRRRLQAQEPGVAAETERQIGRRQRLGGAAGERGNQQAIAAAFGANQPGRGVKRSAVQISVAQRDAGNQPAGAGRQVIAQQRALPPAVEPAAAVEHRRCRRHHRSGVQPRQHRRRQIGPSHAPCTPPAARASSRPARGRALADHPRCPLWTPLR